MKSFTETKSSHIIHSTKVSGFKKYQNSTYSPSKHAQTPPSIRKSFYRYLIFQAMVYMYALLVVFGGLASL